MNMKTNIYYSSKTKVRVITVKETVSSVCPSEAHVYAL